MCMASCLICLIKRKKLSYGKDREEVAVWLPFRLGKEALDSSGEPLYN